MSEVMEPALHVTMFGDFEAEYKGTVVAGVSGLFTQYDRLISLLLYYGDEGVEKKLLEREFFEEREISNPAHTINSIIFNSKKKLNRLGVEGSKIIVSRKNRYYWNSDIPCVIDVKEFERILVEAETCEEEEQRFILMKEACYLYKGDFMPGFQRSIWAVNEANRYQGMFSDAVEMVADYLKEHNRYEEMEQLGRYASKVDILNNWETITMNALVLQGHVEKARMFYEETINYYLNEQELLPSARLQQFMKELGNKLQHSGAVLEEIQDSLSRTATNELGGYVCNYPVFEGIYHVLKRMSDRMGISVYLMMCSIVDAKGNSMRKGAMLREAGERLGDAIRKSVRQSDVINQYSEGQYLILLLNVSRENCAIVQKRINSQFRNGRKRNELKYHVKSIIYNTDDKSPEKLLHDEKKKKSKS